MDRLWPSYTDLTTANMHEILLRDEEKLDETIKLSKEYLEIAVGIRKPTEKEKNEGARTLLTTAIFGGEDEFSFDRIKVMKYPPDFSDDMMYQLFSVLEYAIFRILAENTDSVNGPYLPMLRAEIWKSKEDFDNNNLELCLLRQSAFFETYCRMKLGRSRTTEWRHLELDRVNTLSDEEIMKLKNFREVRDDYAHDWRVYLDSPGENENLRETCVTGLDILSRLHKRELITAYNENCSESISQRYAAEWDDRDTATVSMNASESVLIKCDNCDEKFDPEKEGWKRCPECDSPHDYVSRFE